MKKIAILLLLALPTPALCQATVSDYEAWKAKQHQNSDGSDALPTQTTSPRLTEWLRNPENATLAKDARDIQAQQRIAIAAVAFAGVAGLFALWKSRKVVARGTSVATVAIGAGAILSVRKTVRSIRGLRSAMVKRANERDG